MDRRVSIAALVQGDAVRQDLAVQTRTIQLVTNTDQYAAVALIRLGAGVFRAVPAFRVASPLSEGLGISSLCGIGPGRRQ
jgi:hypothetical protein